MYVSSAHINGKTCIEYNFYIYHTHVVELRNSLTRPSSVPWDDVNTHVLHVDEVFRSLCSIFNQRDMNISQPSI